MVNGTSPGLLALGFEPARRNVVKVKRNSFNIITIIDRNY